MKTAIYEKAGKMTVAEIENQAFKRKMMSLSRLFAPVSVVQTSGTMGNTFITIMVIPILGMKPLVL